MPGTQSLKVMLVRYIKDILSLLLFVGFTWSIPLFLIALTFYIAPGWSMLPQQIAGVGIALAFGFFLSYIMTILGALPLFRRGVALYTSGTKALFTNPAISKRFFPKVQSHRVYLAFLVLLYPLIELSPTIFHALWTFVLEGFAKNAFVACIVVLILTLVIGVIVIFFGLLVYNIFAKRAWDVWDPLNMGFLHFACLSIVYGISLGFSLFAEDLAPGSWKWWLSLWMGFELFFHIIRLFVMISFDKFSPGTLDPTIIQCIVPSERTLRVGLGLLALAGGLYLWNQSEGTSHATATTIMLMLALDRVELRRWWGILRGEPQGEAQGASLQ